MTEKEYRIAINDIVLLCSCAVNNTPVPREQAEKMNLDHLYQAAEFHMLTAVAACALKTAGIIDRKFEQARAKSVRKVTVMDIDRTLIFEKMEQEKIWYLPLKGMVLKDLYPSIGMRQMSDCDILFDSTYSRNVRRILLDLGFTCKHFDIGNHDVYFKPPVSNFEMHRGLFNTTNKQEIYQYYQNVKERLLKDENSHFGYHFSNEDMYIYLTAHEYRHFSEGGTGLRSILDIYVFFLFFGDRLDNAYISAEIQKLGISDFEQQNRSLAMHLFSGEKLTKKDNEIMEYIIRSGTYGTLQNKIESCTMQYGGGHKGKIAYIKNKLFLPMSMIKEYYPFYYKHKLLLPVLFFYRIGRALTVNRNTTKIIINTLKNIK